MPGDMNGLLFLGVDEPAVEHQLSSESAPFKRDMDHSELGIVLSKR